MKRMKLFSMFGLTKTAGRTVVSISATTLPALIRSTHSVTGFFSL